MSLHAQLSPEAAARLRHQHRNSTISSVIIALLSILLIGLILLFILLPQIKQTPPSFVTYTPPGQEKEKRDSHKHTRSVQRQQSAPSSSTSTAKTIAAQVSSTIAIPIPEVAAEIPSLLLSNSNNFDDGWGDDWANGDGSGGGFGSSSHLKGTVEGRLYDFKQTSSGRPLKGYNVKNSAHFTEPIEHLHRSRYSANSLNRYYQTTQPLFIRYIAIPNSDASDGPRFFKAEKEIKPSGWIAHYGGEVIAPKSGTFRFVAAADDYLSVTINKKFRIVSAWPDIKDTIEVRGANASNQPQHKSPFGKTPLTYGDWFTVREGEELDITITLGERPGGKVGFILMLEEKGAKYRTTSSGQTILPPFTMGPLSAEDITELEKFPRWKWETENVPVFNAR